ncbi:Asp23/Gls24 family envelope stress response protein [Microbacterium enclense]|uniref:Asp23/Gls24 family envelope stress response protein n=1 Tax=Microbacterium enclense TaxID=993073 RepID=UPI00203F0C02|nr:Asp23/Gls24 family envelope stress response protein [Microbacterium enclense]MCM3615521.1 Asp23/Gls24 family envelope stress response protein [Microbacterium enclense]
MTSQTPATATLIPDETAEAVAAAVAAVDGVHALGRSVERASNAVRERVGLTRIVPGVKVEADRGGSARVAVSIVVDYPHKLHEVSAAVREASKSALGVAGVEHVDVDVRVTDVWGPFDTEPVAGDEASDGAPSTAARETDDAPTQPGGGAIGAASARDDRRPTSAAVEADVTHDPTSASTSAGDAEHPASGSANADRTDELVADALTDVAGAIAHAAEDVRARRRSE